MQRDGLEVGERHEDLLAQRAQGVVVHAHRLHAACCEAEFALGGGMKAMLAVHRMSITRSFGLCESFVTSVPQVPFGLVG